MAAIINGQTLKLDTGLVVRLIGVQVPAAATSGNDLLLQASTDAGIPTAQAFLERTVLGQRIQLFYGGRRRDRHGRALAHVFAYEEDAGRRLHGDWTGANGSAGSRHWVQGRLLAAGLGLATSFADNRACLPDLIDLEAGAEAGRTGAWSKRLGSPGPVFGAQELRSLFGARHRFHIVEGRVLAAGTVRGTTYLNFGEDWRRDFTIVIRPRARRLFNRPGLPDPGTFAGRRVRVRGWIDLRNGPFIEVDHPEQLELLNEDDPSSQ